MATSTTRASALLLLLLAAPAGAQGTDGLDPLRVNPITGAPRPFFEPYGSDEAAWRLFACLDRRLAGASPGDVPAAMDACDAEVLAACAAVMALYPLARDECALSQRLAWGDVRFEAGNRAYALIPADDGARAEAWGAADDKWRRENGDACISSDPAVYEPCERAREMDRAALYLGQALEVLGAP